MLPGPTIIKACSVCAQLIEEYTIASGNTCGARFWTDGERWAPMLPDAPWLVMCPHCHAPLWVDELKKVGEVDPWPVGEERRDTSSDPPWWLRIIPSPLRKAFGYEQKPEGTRRSLKEAVEYTRPSLEDYFAVLGEGGLTPEKERYVRIRAWWTANDARRCNTANEIPISQREVWNLTSLTQMLDESNANDLVMKAEALRELGRFEEARVLLAKSTDDSKSQAVAIILNLVEKRDPYVREMHFE